MYLDFETKMSLLLITERSPVITISAQIMNMRIIRRCCIFGIFGLTTNITEINAAAIDTSLIKYLRPKIELLKLCLAE